MAWQLVRLSRIIELAMDEPRLRALYPFTSHATLGFRRAAGIGPSLGVWGTPADGGGFVVREPEVHVADAESAVAEVLNRLPDPA